MYAYRRLVGLQGHARNIYSPRRPRLKCPRQGDGEFLQRNSVTAPGPLSVCKSVCKNAGKPRSRAHQKAANKPISFMSKMRKPLETTRNPAVSTTAGFPFIWQREKDSNPHIRSQSPLCYLYTIPLCPDEQKLLYMFSRICQQFFRQTFQSFISPATGAGAPIAPPHGISAHSPPAR